jgi:ferredoxin/flavodoxin---NADP+ reductase
VSEGVADITIIGAGPVGLAAAYYAGHRDASVRIVESLGQLGGQVAAVYPEKHVYDVAGHPKILGQDLVDLCIEQGLQFGADVHLDEEVADLTRIGQNGEEVLSLTTESGKQFLSRALIVTAGHGAFEPRKLGIEGIDDCALDWTLGLQDTADLPITLVHRRDRFRALETSVKEARRLEGEGKVRIHVPSEIREIRGDGAIEAVVVENTQTGELTDVDCEALILLLGFHSHLGSIADWGLELHGKRQILVEPKTMETSLPGVYAAGDVAGYEGKITLISIGFGEAALAANNAMARIRGEKVQPKYSTD